MLEDRPEGDLSLNVKLPKTGVGVDVGVSSDKPLTSEFNI